MGWRVMYNGAWDYAADTRGYTWGWVHEFHTRRGPFDMGAPRSPSISGGALRYGSENVSETYYSARLMDGLFATIDMQHAANPAFNRERGPVWIPTLRLHLELNKDTFLRKRKG